MAQSRFISLTSYCLVEFIFEPLGSVDFLNEDFYLVENKKAEIFQIFNKDDAFNITKNIRDISAIPLGDNKVAYADSEKVPNYLDYDNDMTVYDINGFNVVYDKVRFHFIAGFDFEGFEALVLSIRNEQNDGRPHVFANILFSQDTSADLITFNPKPIFLSDTTFDRYIEFKVPSIKNVNEEYNIAPVQTATFAANITPKSTGSGHIGFVTNAPIEVSISECSIKEKLSTDVGVKYDTYIIAENYVSSLSQTNEFDAVGAYINESSNGDFIEYYLTFNSGFPEELISILNRRNPSDDWIIIHQLSVFEQIGSAFINTSRLVVFQEDGWDEPLVFRPVLKNAGTAVSMSIDLLSRLTNRRNGDQIIREASYSLISPKKYGKKLTTIPLADEPLSQKVYNKIIKKNFEATKLFIEPSYAPGFEGDPLSSATGLDSVEYVPVFINNNNISISNNSGYSKINDKTDEIIFGPGKLKFVLSPFDNVIKLKMFNVVNKQPIPLDLNNNVSKYNLVFETDSGKIAIKNINSDTLENLSTGVLVFNVSKKDSEKIYKSEKQSVYITSVSQDGKETAMYSGEWRRANQQADVDAAISEAKTNSDAILTRESKINKLEAKIEQMNSDKNTIKFNYRKNAIIKNKARPSVVNRVQIKDPNNIKTNTSNSGKGVIS